MPDVIMPEPYLQAITGLQDRTSDVMDRVHAFCAWADGGELSTDELIPMFVELLVAALAKEQSEACALLVPAVERHISRSGEPSREVMAWERWITLGSCFRRTGALDAAERLYDRLLPRLIEPHHQQAVRMCRGIVAAVREDFTSAREHFEAALASGAENELAELTRLNYLQTYMHTEDDSGLEQFLRSWADTSTTAAGLSHAVAAVGTLRRIDRQVFALAILARYTEVNWTDDPASQLIWLEEMGTLLRELSADGAAVDFCQRMIALDDRLATAPTRYLWRDDYDRIGRAYRLLVELYAHVERVKEGVAWSTLSYLEAAKESEFARAVPTFNLLALPPERWAEQTRLVNELGLLEAEAEARLRGELYGTSKLVRAVNREFGEDADGGQMTEIELVRRTAEVQQKLARWRAEVTDEATNVMAFLDVSPDSLRRSLERVTIPLGTALLAYRLNRGEGRITAYLLDDQRELWHIGWDVNPTSIDALLTVLGQFPKDELEYIVERLSTHLIPPALKAQLDRLAPKALVLSADAGLDGVPWEALGRAEWRLGTRLALTRSMSLLRTIRQMQACSEVTCSPTLPVVVADPTEDLPGSAAEAVALSRVLAEMHIKPAVHQRCTGGRFLELLAESAWVHYAGHTNYLRADPLSSHFLLADRQVTVSELAGVTVPSGASVVLSSCESVRAGRTSEQTSPTGLGAVLLLKGASTVIASNWPVADESAGDFMSRFYRRALTGKCVIAEALRVARQELLLEGRPIAEWAQFAALGYPFVRCMIQRSRQKE